MGRGDPDPFDVRALCCLQAQVGEDVHLRASDDLAIQDRDEKMCRWLLQDFVERSYVMALVGGFSCGPQNIVAQKRQDCVQVVPLGRP